MGVREDTGRHGEILLGYQPVEDKNDFTNQDQKTGRRTDLLFGIFPPVSHRSKYGSAFISVICCISFIHLFAYKHISRVVKHN